jgi:hypothetical protein
MKKTLLFIAAGAVVGYLARTWLTQHSPFLYVFGPVQQAAPASSTPTSSTP